MTKQQFIDACLIASMPKASEIDLGHIVTQTNLAHDYAVSLWDVRQEHAGKEAEKASDSVNNMTDNYTWANGKQPKYRIGDQVYVEGSGSSLRSTITGLTLGDEGFLYTITGGMSWYEHLLSTPNK